jgi:hypothetical protein
MRIIYGEEGCNVTWQDPFPKETICKCGEMARIAFVYDEYSDDRQGPFLSDQGPFLSDQRKEGDKLWLHDACRVAVYFCHKGCLEPTALYNQA